MLHKTGEVCRLIHFITEGGWRSCSLWDE